MIKLAQVEGFVKNALRKKLRSDLRKLKILKEADVECCIYHHLRKFLRTDGNWRVFARKYSPRTGYYTDLVILKGQKPRIAIEIKWARKRISRKDRKALRSARRNLKVKKTYFYNVLADGSIYKKLPEKREGEKYRLFERVVDLGYANKRKITEWKEARKIYRV